MDAMIFAAGLGTRLGSLTQRTPKALVPVAGVPMLERVARRLVRAGADRLIINTHRFHVEIAEFVARSHGFGAGIRFSRELDVPLETGGGLRAAAHLFRRDAPFLLHSVDVIADTPLEDMYAEHVDSGALVTLAVNERDAARYLLFDGIGLCGHVHVARDETTMVRQPEGPVRRLAFCGAHVVSPPLLDRIVERGAFPIMPVYLRLAGEGAVVRPFPIGSAAWLDIGTPERLQAAERALRERAGVGGPGAAAS